MSQRAPIVPLRLFIVKNYCIDDGAVMTFMVKIITFILYITFMTVITFMGRTTCMCVEVA